ncbi:glycosyltransferase family 2 protein [Bacillus salipaludis]|uniref:glycosyltransferase family 2 protein n=1 Tax=Bacillus salipaludis TaxID=2547811 RepID=UPI002E20EB53|nr:glycosyltransferase [Bacillus salipaludis]
MRISFVILHYLTEQDTIECIESILNNVSYKEYSIVVVDNGSPNDSGERLKTRYQNNSKVDVIISDNNLGFAKGNNLGFIKAKYEYHSDFIILLNNDTIIEQQDFIDKVLSKYSTKKFAVLGPNIISTIDNNHQNPQPFRIKNKKDAWYQLIRHLALLILNYSKLEPLIKKILNKIKREKIFNTSHKREMIDVQLHGSCLIFSPIYIQKFDGLYDKTFMYFEEDILFYLCKKNNLETLYSPEVIIFHKEDSATNEYLKNNLLKNRFIYKHSLRSIFYLLKLMN